MRILKFMLLGLGAFSMVISVPVLGLGVLGFLGIAADMSPTENRALGVQAVYLGVPLLIGGMVLGLLGLVASAWSRRGSDSKRDAASDGGSK